MRSRYEREAQRELEAEGYQVDWKIRPSRPIRGYSPDYLGAFDLLAHRVSGMMAAAGEPGIPLPELRLIAVKGHEGVPGELRRRIGSLRFPEGVTKEIWCYDQTEGRPRKETIP